MWHAVAVAFIYGAVSVAVNFINKYAVMLLPLPTTLMLIKTFTTLVIMVVLSHGGAVNLPPVTFVRINTYLPIALVYCGHALLVLRSLISLNVPVYNTIKRLTPVIVLATKGVVEQRWPDTQITSAVVLIVSGCVVAGVGDLTFDSLGYIAAIVCAMLQAVYILMAEHIGKNSPKQPVVPSPLRGNSINGGAADGSAVASAVNGGGSSPAEVLFYVGLMGTPMLVCMLLWSEEPQKALQMIASVQVTLGPMTFMLWLAVTAVAEAALTGCMVWCAHLTSAVTTSVVGVLKGVVAVVLGFVILGGVKFAWLNVLGIALNLAGGVWYSQIKMRQNKGGTSGLSAIG